MWPQSRELRPREEERMGIKLYGGNISKNFVTELPNNGIGIV